MASHLLSALLPSGRDRSRTALLRPDGSGLTYGELETQSARFAGALALAGVAPGDRVAVQVEKSAEALFLYLACLRTGAIFLPLNTAYTPAEVEYFVGDAEPALFVGDPGSAGTIGAMVRGRGCRFETLDADGGGSLPELAALAPGGWVDAARGPDDIAAILYTSGTTGRAKGAMLTHENLRSNAEALIETWHYAADDVLIHALPIFHTHGLFVATNVTLMAGAAMIFLQKFDAKQVLSLMPKASILMGVPTFYTRLLAEPGLTREATQGMRVFISGSAPLLAETHREFEARTGHAILERYGMTETNMNTSNPYDGDRVPGSVGFPLPGVDLRICDPQSGARLGGHDVGMIELKGPNVFAGYWRMPEKTAQEFRPDGYFITGDLGRINERGYVWIVGRGKDLIISGGFNVYPKEVEAEIDAVSGVLESAVIGVPHPDFGEAVIAVVVPRANEAPSEADVIGALTDRLARFKQPKRVFVVDALPRNVMGKVQKNVLRETYATTFQRA